MFRFFLSKKIIKERPSHKTRSGQFYSNWQSPAVFAEHGRHMYTIVNIKKNEESEEKLRTNYTYVNTRRRKGVMAFIETSNVYIYTLLFNIAYSSSKSRIDLVRTNGTTQKRKKERVRSRLYSSNFFSFSSVIYVVHIIMILIPLMMDITEFFFNVNILPF